ncbi:hypothetical protein B0H14DRAFT_2620475 [Mycena olivaceomarginata]|nr:hypothetical protein B0H14DRAFT_2620475 [Mycena olivaceomarginata]
MATPQIHRATPSLKALVIERDMCGSWATPVPGANLVALQNAGLLIFDAETVLRPVRLLAEEAKKPHIARQRKVPDRAESGGRVESELSGCSFRERWSATVPQRRYSARQRLTAVVVDKKKRHGLSPVTITHHLIKNP